MKESNTNRKLTIVFLICLTLFVAGPTMKAIAQDSPAAGKITINFQDVDIKTVINSVSRITGRTFIVDPRVKGEVTIVASEEVAEKELYSIFLAILQIHEFAAIESDGVTKIVPAARFKELDDGRDNGGFPDSMETRLYKLKHIQAEKLVAILRPLLPSKSYLAAQVESNMLIISDRKASIDRLLKIVAEVDQAKTGEIEVIRLKHASAADVVRTIEGLEGQSARGGAAAITTLKLIADDRTNSILLSGIEYDLLRIRTLIAHLDSQIESEGATRVIFLRYAKAKDLVPILTGVKPAEAAPKAQAATAATKNEFNIQADDATNALIITAPPGAMKSLVSVIQKLDIRRAQVFIEAVIAEITAGAGAELGVQWRNTDLNNSNDSGVLGGTNFTNSSSPGINALSVTPLGVNGVGGLGSLTGFNLGYIKGTANILGTEILNLGVLVNALATDADTNILSTPSLVTMDNEEAEIIVGQNVPFATGSYTSTGNNNPENPFTTYERQDIGLKLKVTPQVNEGETIRLDIEQEVSNISPSSSSIIGLQATTTREIRTTVMVDDGKILVLGGLINDDIQETIQKVPLLGSIPLLGWLFRYTKTSHNKKNLMVFLRPTIMRDEATGNRITFDKYDYMRRLQQDYREQGVPLLPHVEPPVMEPIETE